MKTSLLVFSLFLLTSACAGHAARTEQARTALDAGKPQKALELYNEELDVDSAKQLPEDTSGDNALLLLDRSMVLQQLDQYELSARDLQVSDKQIEMLDFSRGATDEIGRYLFSDDTGPYKAPAYEKLMINTMNMVNYLVMGDLSGARVEARRLAVMQKYFKEAESPGAELFGAGSYLAGFVFEQSNEAQSALRFYDEALQYSHFETLELPIVRLSDQASYRTPRITKILEQHKSGGAAEQPEAAPDGSTEQPKAAAEGDVLVVIGYGRVPPKIAKRLPIGLALTYASGAISPADHARANALAAQGLVTWVNFPTLGKPRGQFATPEFFADNAPVRTDVIFVDQHAVEAWNSHKGTVVAAAITRMISRVVAGEAARQAGGQGAAGLIASLVTQATLTAADTPDTRSWSTLPARLALGRVRVPAGEHVIELKARGQVLRKTVVVKPGGFAVLNLTVLR